MHVQIKMGLITFRFCGSGTDLNKLCDTQLIFFVPCSMPKSSTLQTGASSTCLQHCCHNAKWIAGHRQHPICPFAPALKYCSRTCCVLKNIPRSHTANRHKGDNPNDTNNCSAEHEVMCYDHLITAVQNCNTMHTPRCSCYSARVNNGKYMSFFDIYQWFTKSLSNCLIPWWNSIAYPQMMLSGSACSLTNDKPFFL